MDNYWNDITKFSIGVLEFGAASNYSGPIISLRTGNKQAMQLIIKDVAVEAMIRSYNPNNDNWNTWIEL